MKSVHGLLIAMALGLAGATLNWFYLEQRSNEVEKVAFIGIRDGVTINRGDVLREDQLMKVEIPRNASRRLQTSAYFWKDLATVVGQSPKRAYSEGELLLRQDLKTPPPELKLEGKDERAMWIPVDMSAFVPRLVVPGRMVSFIVSRGGGMNMPTVADGSETEPPPVNKSDTEIIGPFKILSLGNRLGTVEVMEAAHVPMEQQNVMTISVRVQGDELEPKARRLWELLRKTNFRQVGVLLHPQQEPGE